MQLSEILYQRTNDQLGQLAKLVDGCGRTTRKDDLVRCIHAAVMKPDSLKKLWQRLDDLSRKAITSAYHNDGQFSATAFVAQYGQLPERPQSRWYWQAQPILLDLFIYDNELPSDLLPALADLVPPPERFQLQGLKDAPKTLLNPYNEAVPLIRADTEEAGQHDLLAYLHLIDQGAVKIGYTHRLTGANLKKVASILLNGEFFEVPEKAKPADFIRAFGLDLFARQARWVKGSTLTEAGRAYFQTQDPELLLEAVETWTHDGDFDELSRISALKGLRSGQTRLSRPGERREAVIEALSWSPVEVWINIQDFYRAVKIWHFDFEVETSFYSNLYVGSKDHGGLYGEAYWKVVKGLYINAVIWEYLGSIGAIDLLYTYPTYAGADLLQSDIYFDDDYLSLYDGLRYFRINKLGAYLLGQAREYLPSKPRQRVLFSISVDREVTIIDPDELTPFNQSQLDLLAEPLKKGRYRLDTQKLLDYIESGGEWPQVIDFLHSRHHGPLPVEVELWLDQLRRNSQIFHKGADALFIKVDDAQLLDMALADPVLGKFCKQVGSKNLVIPASKQKALRERLKALEYLLAE